MAITGNLRTMQLSELLQWLSMGQKTGTLVVRGTPGEKRIFFENGRIISSSSTIEREYLGHFLVAYGFITGEELTRAMEVQHQSKILLGKILVMIGAIREEDLTELLKLKAQETIYDIFLWTEGAFEFIDKEIPMWPMVPMSIDVTGIVMEGLRRFDEWERIKTQIKSLREIPAITSPVDPQELPDRERVILAAIDGRNPIGLIAEITHNTDFHVAKFVFELIEAGKAEIVGERWEQPASVPSDLTLDDPAAMVFEEANEPQKKPSGAAKAEAVASADDPFGLDEISDVDFGEAIELSPAETAAREAAFAPDAAFVFAPQPQASGVFAAPAPMGPVPQGPPPNPFQGGGFYQNPAPPAAQLAVPAAPKAVPLPPPPVAQPADFSAYLRRGPDSSSMDPVRVPSPISDVVPQGSIPTIPTTRALIRPAAPVATVIPPGAARTQQAAPAPAGPPPGPSQPPGATAPPQQPRFAPAQAPQPPRPVPAAPIPQEAGQREYGTVVAPRTFDPYSTVAGPRPGAVHQQPRPAAPPPAAPPAPPQPRPQIPSNAIPTLNRKMEELMSYSFTPNEAFILSRINGKWDVRSITKISPFPEIEVLRVFEKLRAGGVISLR